MVKNTYSIYNNKELCEMYLKAAQKKDLKQIMLLSQEIITRFVNENYQN